MSELTQHPIIEEKLLVDECFCDTKCPFLQPFSHPFFHNTAWCRKQLRELEWYDYWQADCIDNKPNQELLNIQDSANWWKGK